MTNKGFELRDEKLWKKFRLACFKEETSVSKKIEELIRKYIGGLKK